MDAWKLIERDHGNITELVHDIPNAMNGSGVIGSLERLLGDLIDELQTYADALDASLGSLLNRHAAIRLLFQGMQGEHRTFMSQLAGLARYRQKHAAGWLHAFGDATFLVDQHLHRHNHELLPAARKVLSREKARNALGMFTRAKMNALKSGRRGFLGGMSTFGFATIAAAVSAALGGLALLAWRAGLLGVHGSRRPHDGRRGVATHSRSDLTSIAAPPDA
ncbi:MAG: hemerythrin domain-containing protein [Methylobacterium sp.]|uniref:hemerythrin domain-containing protein n=1 Tax=Methylobacterium sp. TaxID=409 RepID=UPI0025F57B4E|nr:hemerythrin domain-containing protein [Methylobacterium sp.]MBX9933015.1 hemerythrin domain-containing protein [Methylobacterium sp.]